MSYSSQIRSLPPEPSALPLRRRGTAPVPELEEEEPKPALRMPQPAQGLPGGAAQPASAPFRPQPPQAATQSMVQHYTTPEQQQRVQDWLSGKKPQDATSQLLPGVVGPAPGQQDMVQRGVVHPQAMNLPHWQDRSSPVNDSSVPLVGHAAKPGGNLTNQAPVQGGIPPNTSTYRQPAGQAVMRPEQPQSPAAAPQPQQPLPPATLQPQPVAAFQPTAKPAVPAPQGLPQQPLAPATQPQQPPLAKAQAQAPQSRNMLDTLTGGGRSETEAHDVARTTLGITYPRGATLTPDATGTSYAIAHAGRSPGAVNKPYASYDVQRHRVVVQDDGQGGLGEDARQYVQNMASNKSPAQAPVYYPGGHEPYSATEVQGLHRAGEHAHRGTSDGSPERSAALAQAGLSPEALQQQLKAGRLSVQQATALNQKFNGIQEVNSTIYGGMQGLGAWAADAQNPRGEWFRKGTPEQKAVAVNEYFDGLAAKAQGNLHADPARIELLRRHALGDIDPRWKEPGSTTPGQRAKDGPAGFESIPLKDGGSTLLPGGRWTVEDLQKIHENPVFAKATQAERDAVMNDIIGKSFDDYKARPGFDQAAYQRFNQIAQQARDKSAALKTWSDTGSDAKHFGGNVVGGIFRPVIATATDASAFEPDGEWRVPFGNVGEQAGYWGQKAKDTLQGFLPGARAAHSKLGSDLESLHQDLINGNFPVNDRAKLDEWLAQRSKGLTDSQKGWYEAVQGKPDLGTDKGLAQHIYTHANSLLHPANAELLGRFIQTRDPAVWKELHQNLTRTPQRAETDKAQSKSLEESKIVKFMTNNYGGGDYKEHMISAGDPIEIASNLIPVIRGARAGKAAAEAAVLAGKSTAKRSVGALAKSAAIDLGIGGVQTLIDNPDATFADHMQAGKENIATALGLHAAGHVAGKVKALVTDLNAARKARQTINQLGAAGRQNTFPEAQQLHEAENTLASAIKGNLEKKKSVTGALTEHESGALDKANATLERHAPRDRGPLPAIPDARRTIQDLSGKATAGTLNADEAHGLAHAQRAIAQQRVNDLAPAEANGTLTDPQRRELAKFRETLAASPYGTELPKGPPPGFDPHATNPAHREWHPPHGDKPAHPANDKFTPEALALSDNEIKTTTDSLKAQGHAHDRHGPEVTEGQLSDRAMHGVDPITQTKEDGERSGNDHNYSRHATQFTSDRAMTQAVKAVESSAEYRDEHNKAVTEGKDRFTVKNVSLESALGPNYQEHVRGRTRTGSAANPSGSRLTNLTDGNTLAQYKRDTVRGNFYLNTIFATPSLTHEPN